MYNTHMYSRDITCIISSYDWNINTCSYKFVLRSQKSLHVICTNQYNQQKTIQMSAHRLTAMIVERGKLQLALSWPGITVSVDLHHIPGRGVKVFHSVDCLDLENHYFKPFSIKHLFFKTAGKLVVLVILKILTVSEISLDLYLSKKNRFLFKLV